MQRLAAIDALGRGIANVRANWELALAQLAALLATTLLIVASIVPLAIALGLTFAALGSDPARALQTIVDPATWLSAGVLVALLAATVVGTLALLAYAWFQAGIFGVLVAGDRQAGGGGRRPAALFRTFGWGDFLGWAGRGVWRFFVWYNLYLLVVTLLLALFAVLLVLAIQAGTARGLAAGLGVGCGGLLPLVFLLLFSSLWFAAAKADLPRADSGPLLAWSRGGRVASRRLGGSLLLLLLFVAASTGASMVLLPLQLLAELGLRDQLVAYVALELVVTFLQWAAGTLLGLVFGASFVALVRAELPDAA